MNRCYLLLLPTGLVCVLHSSENSFPFFRLVRDATAALDGIVVVVAVSVCSLLATQNWIARFSVLMNQTIPNGNKLNNSTDIRAYSSFYGAVTWYMRMLCVCLCVCVSVCVCVCVPSEVISHYIQKIGELC